MDSDVPSSVGTTLADMKGAISRLEAELEALRDLGITLNRWNGARAREIQEHQELIAKLAKRMDNAHVPDNSLRDMQIQLNEHRQEIGDQRTAHARLGFRVDELEVSHSKHADNLRDLTRRSELLGETVSGHANKFRDAEIKFSVLENDFYKHQDNAESHPSRAFLDKRITGMEATFTGYDVWSDRVDTTLQKVMDRLDELEMQNDASRPWINTYDDHVNKRQALYSPEMYIVLEKFEKAHTPQAMNEAYKAMNHVLRKIRQGENIPSDNAHRGEDGSSA